MILTRRCLDRNPSEFPGAPTVFVVDRDASVREALGAVIRSAGWQPRMAASAQEFLARPRVMTPSCLLADLHLPGLNGLELQWLVCRRRELPIIFMSSRADLQVSIEAMKGGAFELLTKPLNPEVLLSAMRRAIERSRTALDHLAHVQAPQSRYESLSAREREVVSSVVCGRLDKQVSGDLGITEYTVKAHRGRTMRKMQAASFAELVSMMVSLRRETATMTTGHAPSEPLFDVAILVESTADTTFDLMTA